MYPNPRFPHTCRIYRSGSDGDTFEAGTTEEIYSGECRSYITTRNIGDTKVISAQYTLAIPAYRTLDDGTEERIIVKAFPGDKVESTDSRGRTLKGKVVDCYVGNLGTNIYWNYNAD
jgi:hypothetical protein